MGNWLNSSSEDYQHYPYSLIWWKQTAEKHRIQRGRKVLPLATGLLQCLPFCFHPKDSTKTTMDAIAARTQLWLPIRSIAISYHPAGTLRSGMNTPVTSMKLVALLMEHHAMIRNCNTTAFVMETVTMPMALSASKTAELRGNLTEHSSTEENRSINA